MALNQLGVVLHFRKTRILSQLVSVIKTGIVIKIILIQHQFFLKNTDDDIDNLICLKFVNIRQKEITITNDNENLTTNGITFENKSSI